MDSKVFTLTPCAGECYTVIFSRLTANPDPEAIVCMFALAKVGNPLALIALTADQAHDLRAFAEEWLISYGLNDADEINPVAICVYAALMNIPGVPTPDGWHADWRDQLPIIIP